MSPCRGGLLGWLWSLLGSTTPAYAGEGQPSQGRGWCDAISTTPAYQPAPKSNGVPAGNGVRIVIQPE